MSAHAPNTPTTIPALDGADPLVVVENLTKTYRGRPALDELSLELPPGRIIGLMGSNGSGKTTLLKILAGVLADYDGRVRIAGHDPGPESKALVSFLPDASFLAPGLTAPAAIAAIGPTIRDELLAAKRRRPVAAGPGDHLDPGLVDEFHGSLLPGKARTGLFLRLKPGTDPSDLQGLHGNCPMRHLTTGAGTGSRILQNNSKRLPS